MKEQSGRSRRRPATEYNANGSYPYSNDGSDWHWEEPYPTPDRPVRSRQGSAWQASLALLALILIIAGAATLVIVEMWYTDRVLPGVYVWNIDLSGLTRDEAMEHLQNNFQYPTERHITLRYGEQTWPVDPAYLGTQLDVAATVDTAMMVGHRGDLLARLQEQLGVLVNGTLVMPIFSFDPSAGRMFLSQIAREVNQPMNNASLALADDLSVTIIPHQVGIVLDEEATRQALIQRISLMAGGDVELIVQESEALLTDLSGTRAQVEQILSALITLTAPDMEPWAIEPRTLAGWLILKPEIDANGTASLAVNLDPARLSHFVEEIASQVARPPSDAQFRFDEASGTLVTVVESVPGRTLEVSTTVSLVENAAAGGDRIIPLPLIPVRPAIASEDAPNLGVVELVAEGKTTFAGSSASRIQNIKVGAAQFDGLLIAPDETFSFNQYLGEVTAEKGYEESIIIWGNTTRADVGGGLCQVSSTAFRAAFWAGVPIVERWPHAFRVSYYEPPKGLDATIYSPSVDLKWANDTGHYILIHTYVDEQNKTLTFRYYGTKPNRTVEMDGPYESNPVARGPDIYRDDPTLPKGQTKQIEWAKDGLDVTVYRVITENGQSRQDTFFSRYMPWQAVYLVGTRED